jgi:ATP:corrinoid adenosyltransferase
MEEEECLYSIRLSFQKKIIEGLNKKYNEDVLKYLKPIYPWKNIILDELNIKNYIKELELEKILKKVEKNADKEDIIRDIKSLIDKLK